MCFTLWGVTYRSNGGLFTISGWRMSHICTEKNHRLLENQWPVAAGETSQFRPGTKAPFFVLFFFI